MGKRKRTPKAARALVDVSSITTAIDHQAFPHIINLILEHAPGQVLRAFRPTSKHYLSRVDAVLGKHIILSTFDSLMMTVSSPHGPYPGLTFRSWEYDSHFDELASNKIFKGRLRTAKRRLLRVRVLDVIGDGDARLGLVSRMLKELTTLRLAPDKDGRYLSSYRFKAPTRVVFADLGSKIGRQPGVRSAVGFTRLDKMVKRLVYNVKYHCNRQDEAHHIVLQYKTGYGYLNYLVLVFTHWRPVACPTKMFPIHPEEDCRISINQQRWTALLCFIRDVLLKSQRYSMWPKVTMVDFETIDPRYMGFGHRDGGQLRSDILRDLAVEFDNMSFCPSMDEVRGEALAGIEFVTGSEYEATIGPEDFRTETEWPTVGGLRP